MNNNTDTYLIYEFVESLLLTEESCRKLKGGSLGDAMMARGRPIERVDGGRYQSRSKSKGKSKGKCWNYRMRGRLRKDCRSKNTNQENPKSNLLTTNSNNSQVNIVEVKDSYKNGKVLSINSQEGIEYQ